MTGRERIVAAARGGEVDRRPVACATGVSENGADCVVVGVSDVTNALRESPDRAVLAKVVSPLGRDLTLVKLLASDPSAGAERLALLADQARQEMRSALEAGADGIYYALDGAYPAATTPMEYGGHFLELDRQLLEEVRDARFNLLFVCGEREPYIDFVSDLPAHALAWDSRSGVSVGSVRSARSGALAYDSDEADIRLKTNCREEARA